MLTPLSAPVHSAPVHSAPVHSVPVHSATFICYGQPNTPQNPPRPTPPLPIACFLACF